VVQGTAERALRHENSFKPGTDPRKWLFTIMHTAFVNEVQRANRACLSSSDDGRVAQRRPGEVDMTRKRRNTMEEEDFEEAQPVVYVVDDDPTLRNALDSLFRSVGLQVQTFAMPEEFIRFGRIDACSCLVLDVRFQGQSGLNLQSQVMRTDSPIPIVFMTGHGDVEMTVKAMKAGAVDFLAKPFRDQDMLDAVAQAIARDRARRRAERNVKDLRERYESLTPREREVLSYVVAGLMNKQIANELDLSEITVKIHRKHAMDKMDARSVVDLVRKAQALDLPMPPGRGS
jgi:RNA polymerase sigma factor (sigma-70 family)